MNSLVVQDPLQPLLFGLFDIEAAIWNIVFRDAHAGATISEQYNNIFARISAAWAVTWTAYTPTLTDWQNGKKDNNDAGDTTLNQRFPFKTTDATKKDFYETNISLYWFGSYAIGIWYTLWFSYIGFGMI